METLTSSAAASPSPAPHFTFVNINKTSKFSFRFNPATNFQVELWKSCSGRIIRAQSWSPVLGLRTNVYKPRGCGCCEAISRQRSFPNSFSCKCSWFSNCYGFCLKSEKHRGRTQKAMDCSGRIRQHVSIVFVRFVTTMLLVTSVSLSVSNTPSWALSEENLLFLEAWRTIDRAYVDKTFNGQSWFRYRENALRNEPMNTREETYMAIRKMLATLDDPFTRFLAPEKFKSLRAVWNSRGSNRCRAFDRLSFSI